MRNQGEITEKRDACAERGCTESSSEWAASQKKSLKRD